LTEPQNHQDGGAGAQMTPFPDCGEWQILDAAPARMTPPARRAMTDELRRMRCLTEKRPPFMLAAPDLTRIIHEAIDKRRSQLVSQRFFKFVRISGIFSRIWKCAVEARDKPVAIAPHE
jgi:hypothetical protein